MLDRSIKSRKGQGIIGEILIFGAVIFISIMIFILLSSSDRNFKEEAEVDIKASMEKVHFRSIVTEAFNDRIDKLPHLNNDVGTVIDNSVANQAEDAQYGDLKGITLTSYYLSTTGNHLYINGSKYDRDLIEDTLENYYKAKIYSSFKTSTTNRERPSFSIEIIEGNQRIKAEHDTNSGPTEQEGSPARIILPLQLSNDKVADIQFTVVSTGGVFAVE